MQKLVIIILMGMGSFVYPSIQNRVLGGAFILGGGALVVHRGIKYIEISRKCSEAQQKVSAAEQVLAEARKFPLRVGGAGELFHKLPMELTVHVAQFCGKNRVGLEIKEAELYCQESYFYRKQIEKNKIRSQLGDGLIIGAASVLFGLESYYLSRGGKMR